MRGRPQDILWAASRTVGNIQAACALLLQKKRCFTRLSSLQVDVRALHSSKRNPIVSKMSSTGVKRKPFVDRCGSCDGATHLAAPREELLPRDIYGAIQKTITEAIQIRSLPRRGA